MIGRDDLDWDVHTDIRRYPEAKPWQGFRLLCVDADGTAQGYASYTVDKKWTDMRPQSVVELSELVAATPGAEARLWRFVAELDLVAAIKAGDRPTDEVLPWLLENGRLAKQVSTFDFIWVRPLDVARLLTTRAYDARDGRVFDVVDDQGLATGRFTLDASPAGATCLETTRDRRADVPGEGTRERSRWVGRPWTPCGGRRWLDEHVARRPRRRGRNARSTTVAPWCNTWFLNRAYHRRVMGRGLRRIAVVDRGEAAMRLVNAVRELRVERGEDLRTIALHTAAERTAMFVREADEAVVLDEGGLPRPRGVWRPRSVAARGRRRVGRMGLRRRAPGVRRALRPLGVTFVGPGRDVMRRLGDKIGAKLLAEPRTCPSRLERWTGRDDRSAPRARRGASATR